VGRIPVSVHGKAWQRTIREDKEREYGGVAPTIANIKDAVCRPIYYKEAESIIHEYEWLGTMGQGIYSFGIFYNDILAGAVCMGLPGGTFSGAMYGKHNIGLAICIERGACVWWAHPHSASKLIMYAVRWMSKNTKYRIFFAYSDEDAGEIGTVYQACNFTYMGKSASGGSQNKLITPDGLLKDSRHIIKLAQKYTSKPLNCTSAREVLHANGWSSYKTKPKSRYVLVFGDKREVKTILKDATFKCQPYPKRNSVVE